MFFNSKSTFVLLAVAAGIVAEGPCTQKIPYKHKDDTWAMQAWTNPTCSGDSPDYYSHTLADKPNHWSDCFPLHATSKRLHSFILQAKPHRHHPIGLIFYSDIGCKHALDKTSDSWPAWGWSGVGSPLEVEHGQAAFKVFSLKRSTP
ncbi:hypothetical protein BV22DRAFT_1128586 [Leucogyrophana mollusca]|uniref:Uncharacterized protein n=1 Tax=Leucogyrophana mollusca TaxID=85980 RepID=A0ACB8BKT1_9AGAM|nr:hypothetical protein BV22DRAFT_1128586 [Leucogyrophana mollusca]